MRTGTLKHACPTATVTRALHERRVNDSASALAHEWKRLGRAATFVAVLTSPVLFVLLYRGLEWGFLGSLLGTILGRRDLPRR